VCWWRLPLSKLYSPCLSKQQHAKFGAFWFGQSSKEDLYVEAHQFFRWHQRTWPLAKITLIFVTIWRATTTKIRENDQNDDENVSDGKWKRWWRKLNTQAYARRFDMTKPCNGSNTLLARFWEWETKLESLPGLICTSPTHLSQTTADFYLI